MGAEIVAWPKNAPSLEQRAELINAAFAKGDTARIEAGRELLEAYEEVVGRPWGPGKSGGKPTGWHSWLSENVARHVSDCQKVMRIAASDDPQAELEAERQRRRDAREQSASGRHEQDPTEGMEYEEGATCGPLPEYEPSAEVKVVIAALKKVKDAADRAYVKFYIKEKW